MENIALAKICNPEKITIIPTSGISYAHLYLLFLSFMSDSRITETRRRFVEVLSEQAHITFVDLRERLVKSKIMNLATLYRIIDAFKAQELIHEITIAGERVIFPCQCIDATGPQSITISFCENCGRIYDQHVKLGANLTISETFQHSKSCNACVVS